MRTPRKFILLRTRLRAETLLKIIRYQNPFWHLTKIYVDNVWKACASACMVASQSLAALGILSLLDVSFYTSLDEILQVWLCTSFSLLFKLKRFMGFIITFIFPFPKESISLFCQMSLERSLCLVYEIWMLKSSNFARVRILFFDLKVYAL